MTSRVSILSASLLLSLASAAAAAPPTFVEVEAGRGWEWEAIEDLFSLPQPARFGVGFVLDEELVAAPLELVHGAEAIHLGLPDGRRLRGEVASVLTASQTALLSVSGLSLPETPLVAPRRGATVHLAGTLGRVISADSRGVVAWLSAPPPPLAPGAPLVDSEGAVVGLHARHHEVCLPWGLVTHLVTAQSIEELVLQRALRQLGSWLSEPPWLRGVLSTPRGGAN